MHNCSNMTFDLFSLARELVSMFRMASGETIRGSIYSMHTEQTLAMICVYVQVWMLKRSRYINCLTMFSKSFVSDFKMRVK
jgi:hypothetical protein